MKMITERQSTEAQLREIALHFGVGTEYTDNDGKVHQTPAETLKAHLTAMGLSVDPNLGFEESLKQWTQKSWSQWLEPVKVVHQKDLPAKIELRLPKSLDKQTFQWCLTEENGTMHQNDFIPASLKPVKTVILDGLAYCQYVFPLPVRPPQGYHHFKISAVIGGQAQDFQQSLIVTPEKCYIPAGMYDGKKTQRIWGPSVQLYAIRSRRNWGMGDFTDLASLVEWSGREGANIIGINPLHALSPVNPQDASPYCPSSRLFMNIFYLDIESIPIYQESEEIQRLVLSEDFQSRLTALREAEFVDYVSVCQIKFQILEKLYHAFRQKHLNLNSIQGESFQQFVSEGGSKLYQFALFEALQERFHNDDPAIWGWLVWPESYKSPESKSVKDFSDANQERIGFYQYLQWLIHQQLQAVGNLSWKLGLTIGLYMDLAVGLNAGGAEVWANQDLFSLKTGIGTPPDAFSTQGQNWGLPPIIPHQLKQTAYQPFIDTLRENMRYAGALRIDHFMAMMRLFWVPAGTSAANGTYIQYPFEDFLGILALESHRNQTIIIGEDLGTVPSRIREKMLEWDILSYKIFYFEKTPNGEFKAPEQYQEKSVVALSSQDLPTLKGFWYGQADVLKNQLGLIPPETFAERHVKDLLMDRMHLLAALNRVNILPEGVTTDPASVPYLTAELIRAVHLYLARTPCLVQLVQFEDILEQLDQVNMPGTTHEHPNWSRKLTINIEDLGDDTRIKTLFEVLRQERDNPRPNADILGERSALTLHTANIPQCTYRFQFNQTFTFKDAAEVVPYLHKLGITHCYTSPILAARAGSPHGYDIINHGKLNPEIGSEDDFNHLVETLKAHNIGLIIDIVPNHMGIGSDNGWWMDVLENGPASEYANYFDIDWIPLKDELFGKVLLPVLGNPYGRILENEELQLQFNPENGLLTLHYYDHFWPINPNAYPFVLKHRLEVLAARLGENNEAFLEYQSIITAFENMPSHTHQEQEHITMRRREKAVTLKRLVSLCHHINAVAEFILENLADFNAVKDNPINRQRIHQLLELQAYRLAYWRVASDEINYRRFFDVNDLAGVNMEVPKVFWDTHHLILKLIQDGKICGLRVDHPDGLYDPAAYFKQLQGETCRIKGLDTLSFKPESRKLPLYIVVEKILASYERLPETWMVHGTTGYEFANSLTGLFIDKSHEQKLTEIYKEYTSPPESYHDLVYRCKKLIMKISLSSELNVLANQLNRLSEKDWLTRDFTLNNIRSALSEVVACFPVYRTYVTPSQVSKKDQDYIEWAIGAAKKRSLLLDLSIFDFIYETLILGFDTEKDETYRQEAIRFAMKFQQFTGPVMAKGLEDTGFYRYNRLVAINEVGNELHHFGTSIIGFHHQNIERLKTFPHTMLNTSTHDSKRSEDVRARISVISEMPDLWQKNLQRWSRLNRSKKSLLDEQYAPDANDEYLLYQTLLGVWPFEEVTEAGYEHLSQRVENYFLKAAREAKVHTSWINQNLVYEEALVKFIRALLTSPENKAFLEDFLPFQKQVAFWGMLNSLSQTVLKLTVPGVPDIYQGNDLWDFSLVDPDNRRPVDYKSRTKLLDSMASLLYQDNKMAKCNRANALKEIVTHYEDGRLKLYITACCLNFRKGHSVLFETGDYVPLDVSGEYSDYVIAFTRQTKDKQILVIVPRLVYQLTHQQTRMPVGKATWKDTSVMLASELSSCTLRNIFTHELIDARDPAIPVAEMLKTFPVGIFEEAR